MKSGKILKFMVEYNEGGNCMESLKGYIHGNTVVVENEELNLYEGCEVEIHVIEKKPMTFQGACAALQKFENSGVWEGNLDEMRECRG
ncbi:MAG: hypothetical protein J5857_10750 [Treponema sp.]|nr:hypothetical protein [Treponema sp.]